VSSAKPTAYDRYGRLQTIKYRARDVIIELGSDTTVEVIDDLTFEIKNVYQKMETHTPGLFVECDGFQQLRADTKTAADDWIAAIQTNVSVLAQRGDTYESRANFLTMRRIGSRWQKLLREKPKTADKYVEWATHCMRSLCGGSSVCVDEHASEIVEKWVQRARNRWQRASSELQRARNGCRESQKWVWKARTGFR
jgi:hypothetical protein